MKIENAIPAIIDYCRYWIDDFDLRAELAFNMAFRERIPIENASPSLADSITAMQSIPPKNTIPYGSASRAKPTLDGRTRAN